MQLGSRGALILLLAVSPGQAMLGEQENSIFTAQKAIDSLIYSFFT